jgi:endo-1,4-beta-xylanase
MAVLPCINAPLTLTAFSLSRGEGETTMFLPVWQQILHSARMRFVVPGFLVWALPLLSAGPARAQVVAAYTFADGTADGWTSFNGASMPVASNAAAYGPSGSSYSLLTTTSSSGQSSGPSISLTRILLPGAQYTITGYVMLTSGEGATSANFTIERTDSSCTGGACYDTIGNYQVGVTATGWTQIGGSYTVSATETALNLYVQLIGPSSAQSLYLADVVITETAPPLGGTPVATYTFSDGGLDGWFPFGSANLANVASPVLDPSGDLRALEVTSRTAGYMGPALNLLTVNGVVPGAIYQISAWVLLAAPDSSNLTATLSAKLENCGQNDEHNNTVYNNIATSPALSSTAWTLVSGTFTYSNVPGPPSTLTLYLQSSSATDSFYIGHVTIGQLVPSPVPVSQQNHSGLTTNFEDGGLDGWSSRSGQSVLTNTTAEAYNSTNSLLTTNRIASWDGPQISVSNGMYPGSEYSISVWVQIQPVDGQQHTINMSLQTTFLGNVSYPGITAISIPGDGQWHQANVPQYLMSSNYDQGGQGAFLYLQTSASDQSPLVSFYIDDFQLTYIPPPIIQTNIPSIFQTYAHFFPIGAEIDTTDLSGPHEQLLTQHFNSIVSGNDMKWANVEPTEGNYSFGNADEEVGLAICHNMLVRGHNLVWATGEQTPSYAFGDGTNSPANQAAVTGYIQEHIQSEVQHFGSNVYAWDVVNEPLDPTQSDCLFHGPFYQVLGPSYIDIALQAARQYTPAGTKLFINDYNTTDPDRLACMVRVVDGLKKNGVPIDGIGHEMHNHIDSPSTFAMVGAIGTIAVAVPNVEQQITEMDESVYTAAQDATAATCEASNYGINNGVVPPAILDQQGWLYAQYFGALRFLKPWLSAVTFWGFADDDTWLSTFPCAHLDEPLPFDSGLQAKPAYWGIVDPLELPGSGLSFAVSGKTGTIGGTRTWTVTATNPSRQIAYNTQIASFRLVQVAGWRCNPVVTPPGGSFPVSLGDVPADGSASIAFSINFDRCPNTAEFILSMPWSSAVYEVGALLTPRQSQ